MIYVFRNQIETDKTNERIDTKTTRRIVRRKNTSISNWELELNQPSAESLANLCKTLGVSADYLLDWDENKHSDRCRFCYDDDALF